ncbi:MAG TPA: hypothetical protein VGC44_04925 [Longimicrobiales bacterium]
MARWVPPLVYALVTIVLFREVVFTGARLLGVDNLELGLFARDFYTDFIRNFHRFPVWQPLLYGGMPFIDGMHGDIFYPPSLALFFMNAETMWGWKMILHIFMAGCFTYLWLREINVSRGAAFVGGLIYMSSPLLVSMVYPGGDGKLFNYALAPLLFWLTERLVVGRRVRDFAAFALGIALLVFTSQMQVAYFCIWGVSLYFFFRVFQVWRADRTGGRLAATIGGFAVAGALGVGAAAVQFLPPLQYLREWSHRADKTAQAESGYAHATSWSLHPEEIVSLAVPDFVGDNVQTEVRTGATYWGRNPFKLNHEYAGFIPLLLLPLVFIRRRSGQAIFFTVLAALALLYALGGNTPFFRLFYLIPGVSLFRAPSLIIFLYGLSIATLGALAIDRALEWVRDEEAERSVRRVLWIGVAVMGVLALLASAGLLTNLWRGLFPFQGTPQQVAMKVMAIDANMPFIKTGFWLIFAIAVAVAGAWEGYARGVFGARGLIIALAALAFFDAYRVDRPFIRGTVLMNQSDDPIRYTPDESITFLQSRQQAGEVFRALDLSTLPVQLEGQGYRPNTLAMHGIEQLAGHHGNELGRYRQLIGGDVPTNLLTSQLKLADVTNTTYLLSPQPIQVPGLTEVFRGSRTIVYRKDTALPRAFVVGDVQVVADTGAVNTLLSPTFNAGTTALLAEPLPGGVTVQPGARGTVQWLERGNAVQRLQVNATAPALLIVLDNYYKAWRADVDGREAPLLRADHTFRAIPVPAGNHVVTMRYSTDSVQASAFASGIILLLLAVLAFGAPLLDRIRRPA